MNILKASYRNLLEAHATGVCLLFSAFMKKTDFQLPRLYGEHNLK